EGRRTRPTRKIITTLEFPSQHAAFMALESKNTKPDPSSERSSATSPNDSRSTPSARSSTSAGRWKCRSRRLAEVGGLLCGDVVVGREQFDISSRRQGHCRTFSFRKLLPEMARPPDVGTVGRRVQPDQRK